MSQYDQANRRSFAVVAVAALLGLLVFGCASPATPHPLQGRWVGTIDVGGPVFMVATFTQTSSGLRGTLEIHRAGMLNVGEVSYSPSNVRFEARHGDEAYLFKAALSNGLIAGELTGGGLRLKFRLRRLFDVDQRLVRSFLGTYQVGADWTRSLKDCIDLSGFHQLVFVNGETGGRKALFPISENQFYFGPGFLIPEPIEGIVTLHKSKDGRPYLIWDQYGSEVMIGHPVASESERLAGCPCERPAALSG